MSDIWKFVIRLVLNVPFQLHSPHV